MRISILLGLVCLPLVAFGQSADEHERRANDHYMKRQFSDAIREWTRAIAVGPNWRRYNMRGASKHQQKDYKGAVVDYTQALRFDSRKPDRGATFGNRAACKFMLLDFKGAFSDVSWAMKLRKSPEVGNYDVRGHCYLFQGRYKDAIGDFSRLFELAKTASLRGHALHQRGVARLLLGQRVQAKQDFEAALKASPSRRHLANWIYRAGGPKTELEANLGRAGSFDGVTARFTLGRIDAARLLREARGLLRRKPYAVSTAHGYVGLKADGHVSDRATALRHFRECVRLGNRWPYGMTQVYARARVLEADRGDPLWAAEVLRIKEHGKKGRFAEAVAVCTRALDRGRLNRVQRLQALLYRSNYRTRLGHYRKAVSDLSEARRVNSTRSKKPWPDFRKDYADLLSRRAAKKEAKGELLSALQDRTGAIVFKPKDPARYLARARTKLKMSDEKGCRVDALYALRLDPNNEDAKALLAKTKPEPKPPTTGKTCSGCSKALQPNDKFCSNCGKKAGPPTCAGCTKRVQLTDKFCGNCGRKQ